MEIHKCFPYLAMTVVIVGYMGSNFLTKAALEDKMSFVVFILYRHIIAFFLLAPFAYFLERKQRPDLTLMTSIKIFGLTLCGITLQQNLFYAGLNYATPTVVSALSNIIPAVTFLLAILLRKEKLNIKSAPGKAKLIGTLICIAGALAFTFWKGFVFHGSMTPLIMINGKAMAASPRDGWIKGSALLTLSNIAFSLWLIQQALVYPDYPAPLSLSALMCLFGALQGMLVALAFDRNPASWRIQWNIQLLTTIYCALMNSIVIYCLQAWCINKRGPVFVSMFQPLLLALTGIISFLIFAEELHLGSLVGAFIIVVGFYCVLWGKSKELQPKANCTKECVCDG